MTENDGIAAICSNHSIKLFTWHQLDNAVLPYNMPVNSTGPVGITNAVGCCPCGRYFDETAIEVKKDKTTPFTQRTVDLVHTRGG